MSLLIPTSTHLMPLGATTEQAPISSSNPRKRKREATDESSTLSLSNPLKRKKSYLLDLCDNAMDIGQGRLRFLVTWSG